MDAAELSSCLVDLLVFLSDALDAEPARLFITQSDIDRVIFLPSWDILSSGPSEVSCPREAL